MGQVQFMPFEAVDADRLITDRAARTAVAIERFRRDHGGGLPKTLADLVPIYLSVVPGDPSSGGPLLFRQDSDSYTIYGVGIDGKDDGGDLSSELEESIKRAGRRVLRGRDAGIRILIH
jgi:hypothetical protein